MIVVDASVLVELLTDVHGLASVVRDRLAEDTDWIGPEHLHVEVASALRGLWLGGRSTGEEFDRQIGGLSAIGITTMPVLPLLPRIRELAPNLTVYDAAYVVLAERAGVPLVTLDGKLAAVPGVRARVHVLRG